MSGSIVPTSAPQQVVVQQDNFSFPVSIILDETNYQLWSQLMEMRISARKKLEYLTGDTAKPNTGDANLASWITENNRVKKIWDAISKTFYDGSDETCLFKLNKRSFSTKQNGRPLSTYYNELVSIFQEIDHRSMSQGDTVEGVVQLHLAMACLRVHIFLSGLDSEFKQVCGEILGKDPKLDLESTYAYVRKEYQQRQTMGNRPISESATMKKVVSRSSAEAEFRDMAHGVCELLWIQNVLKDFGIQYEKSMNLHCDNKAAIEIAQNPVQYDRTKHDEVDRHFIKEKLDKKIRRFSFVRSKNQLADVLTKAVSGKVFQEAIDKLGMIDIFAPT
ncbi:hypothetical protein K2173_005669 [Erythroxylum novogranatense]|uniref:Retrotransposon Copia-like N-terminal domain-containing protein n=1 Tax=Erythroxylum novogranatense TaxID=1862640 RepID=A0AAV8SR25_9ROSI|nr:hypothetical protein K2173_005669 [Erythroxylum novogranatense]